MTFRKMACLMSIIAITVALVAVLPSADAAEGDTFKVSTVITDGTTDNIEILYHIVSDNEVEVTNSHGVPSSQIDSSYSNCNGSLTIPSKVTYEEKEYTVIGIGKGAFWDTPMTSITLPDTLEYIGEQAFSDTESLSSITIPASVTSIGNKAFSYADTTKANSLTTISFASESKLTTVGDNLFEGRTELKNVEIPAGVTDLNIRPSGNPYGQQLSGLHLGALNAWDDAADEVTFADGSPFSKDQYGLLYDGTTLVANLNTDNDDYIGIHDFKIKEGTTAIGDAAMISKTNGWTIGTITIPSSVETIGKSAFRYSSTSGTTMIFEGMTAPVMNNSFTDYGVVLVPEGYAGYEKYFELRSINVVMGDGTTTNTSTKTDSTTSQELTITTITNSGEQTPSIVTVSTTLNDDTTEDTIETTATIKNGEATVSVSASSGESLFAISGQIDLIERNINDDVSDISVTISDSLNRTVVLTSKSLEHLCDEAADGSISIEINPMTPSDFTPGQSDTIGDCFSYDFSAILKMGSDGETTETKITNLGDYVTVYIPYDEKMGYDASSLGIYYVQDDGTKVFMDSVYVKDKFTNGSFVFKTNHFSVFAALPLEEEVDDGNDDPYYPPYYPDDDYPFIPPTIVIEDDGSDEMTKIAACAAAAVAVAIMAMFLIIDNRKK